MKKSPPFSFCCTKVFFIGLFALIFFGSGCSLKEIHKQTQVVENLGTVGGKIEVTSDQKGTLFAVLYRDENGIPALLSQHTVSQKGEFLFSEAPGDYYLAAYIDNNKDGEHQPEEHGNFFGMPTKITIAAQKATTVPAITISGVIAETGMKSIGFFTREM